MDALSRFLDDLKQTGKTRDHLLGFLNVLIGRRIAKKGKVVAAGLTWREVASWLKKVRWDPSTVAELGIDENDLPPRDRQRFWYLAIAQAGVDGPAAQEAGDRFAVVLHALGYDVGTGPGQVNPPAS